MGTEDWAVSRTGRAVAELMGWPPGAVMGAILPRQALAAAASGQCEGGTYLLLGDREDSSRWGRGRGLFIYRPSVFLCSEAFFP